LWLLKLKERYFSMKMGAVNHFALRREVGGALSIVKGIGDGAQRVMSLRWLTIASCISCVMKENCVVVVDVVFV